MWLLPTLCLIVLNGHMQVVGQRDDCILVLDMFNVSMSSYFIYKSITGQVLGFAGFFYQAPPLHELWSPDVGFSLIELWGWSKPIVCADAYMPSCCLICKHATPSCHLVPFQVLDVYVHVFIGYHLVTYTSVSSIVPSHSQFISQLVWNMYIVGLA